MRTWDIALPFALGLALLTAAVLTAVAAQAVPAAWLSVLGAVCLAACWWGRGRRRRWIEDLGHGFRVIDRNGRRDIDDSAVLSMALLHRTNYSQGLPKSVTRRFRVWLQNADAEPEPLEMVYDIPTGQPDPLGPLVGRIDQRLLADAHAAWQAGRSALGEHWRLEGADLTLRTRAGLETCKLGEIAAVQPVDRHLCLWRHGDEEPFGRLPEESANAYILWRLVAEYLAQHPVEEKAPPADGVGRLIFQRRPARDIVWTLFVAGLVLGVLSVGLIIAAFRSPPIVPFAVGCPLLAVAALLAGWQHHRAVIRCHQYGVVQSRMFGRRTLRYADIESFTCRVNRYFSHGIYNGSKLDLTFDPDPTSGARRIRHGFSLDHIDPEFEQLRDQVAAVIATRLAQRLATDGSAGWTANLRFLQQGLEYHPSGWEGSPILPSGSVRRKTPILIPYDSIEGYQIYSGQGGPMSTWVDQKFVLWVKGQTKPVVTEDTSAPNFFPGYALLASWTRPAQG
jgi:hypothetical protein